jgi:hypothetical protein
MSDRLHCQCNSLRPWRCRLPLARKALPAVLITTLPLLLALPALAAPIDIICALPPASGVGLGTLVDFSLKEGSAAGSSFWPVTRVRRPVRAQITDGQIAILQPTNGALLFRIDRLSGSITSPDGERGRCTNAGPVRVDRAI